MLTLLAILFRKPAARGIDWVCGMPPTHEVWAMYYALFLMIDAVDGIFVHAIFSL